jgi:hypothetical protein
MVTMCPDHERAEAQVRPEVKPQITVPYILIVSAPLEIDQEGRRWAAASWAKDLALHLDYLTNLTVVSPATRTKRSSPTYHVRLPDGRR